MKKKILFTLLMCTVLSASLFASASSFGPAFYADEAIDASTDLVPGTRDASLTLYDMNGNVAAEYSASAVQGANNTAMVKRALSGDREVFALLDSLYDGYVVTPYYDSILDFDVTDTYEEDGMSVYEYDVKLGEDVFYRESSDGNILGWDEDENDFDSDEVHVKVYIDKDSRLVRQEMTVERKEPEAVTITQNTDFMTVTVDGEEYTVPSSVTTEGCFYMKAGGSNDVYDIVDFSVSETMSDYFVFNNYRK